MRVAVLVHTDVVRDARVRKEVATLVRAGHEVHVFGMSKAVGGRANVTSIEGSKGFQLVRYSALLSLPIAFIAALLVTGAAGLTFGGWILPHLTACFALAAALLVMRQKTINLFPLRMDAVVAARAMLIVASVFLCLAMYRNQLSPIALSGYLLFFGLAGARLLTASHVFDAAFGMAALLGLDLEARLHVAQYRRLARILEKRISSADYDVLHCHDVIALITGSNVKRRNPQIKLIWDAHEIYESLAQERAGFGVLVRKLIMSNQHLVDGFITISESFAEFYGRNYSLPKARIVMNATRFETAPTDEGVLRAAAGLGADREIVLFHGGLAPKRGLEALVEAAAVLPEPWSIVIMGWGRLEANLKRASQLLAQGRDPRDARLVVLPAVDQSDLSKWTAGARIGIIPYENTGLNHLLCTPNKLWEYPNAGVPILATNLVEMARIVDQWGIGFLLPRDFVASDIVQFFKDVKPADIDSKKRQCEAFSRSMSWETFEMEIVSLYENLYV